MPIDCQEVLMIVIPSKMKLLCSHYMLKWPESDFLFFYFWLQSDSYLIVFKCEQTKLDFFISDLGHFICGPSSDSYPISGFVTTVKMVTPKNFFVLFLISHFSAHVHIACRHHSVSAPHSSVKNKHGGEQQPQ